MVSGTDLALLAPELIVTAAGLLVLLLDLLPLQRSRGLLTGVSLVGLATAFAVVVGQAGGARALAFSQLHVVDDYALFFKGIFLASAAIVILAAARFLKDRGLAAGEFNALLLFATLGTLLMASANDLLSLFIGLETMSICSYALCGYMKRDQRCSEGALKYLLMGVFSTGVILYGMALLYGATGSTALPAVGKALGQGLPNPAATLAMVLLAAGFGFKIAAVPFHMYLPDMYEGAPTPVVAFMAGAVELAGAAVLVRVFLLALPGLRVDWALLFWVLSALTMTVGNLIAIAQTNVKRMLAYSTIAHMGYLLMGPVAGTQLGVSAVLFYSLVYALMTIGAFAVVILIARATVQGDEIDDFAGLGQRSPLAAAAMLLFLLSLTGIPPTAGFVGKFYLFAAAIDAGYIWLAIIAVVNSAISLFYYMRVVMAMYMRELPARGLVLSPSLALHAALVLAALGTLLFGIDPGPLFAFAKASAAALAG